MMMHIMRNTTIPIPLPMDPQGVLPVLLGVFTLPLGPAHAVMFQLRQSKGRAQTRL